MNKQTSKNRISILTKNTSENKERLYLVWFRDSKRVWESTGEFRFIEPTSILEKHHNKEVKKKIEALKNIRETQFFSDEIDLITEQKKLKTADFISYFDKISYLLKTCSYTTLLINQIKELFSPANRHSALSDSLKL